MRTITLPNSFFDEAASQLKQGQTVRMNVLGESMYPFLHNGDCITLIPYKGEDLPLYTGVFYKWNDRYMTHRLVKKDESTWHMLGDGNIYRIESLPQSEIIGVLTQCERPDGTIIDCTSKQWFRNGKLWYKARLLRRFLYKPLRMIGV